MLAMLTKLLKYVPWIDDILSKIGGESSRAQEIKAEAELADIKGFHRTGRISARHAWKYALVAMAVFLVITFCIKILFPSVGISTAELLNGIGGLGEAIKSLLELEF